MELSNERWDDDYFRQEREKTLALWPTGKDVDLDEAVEYHLNLPDAKKFASVVRQAKAQGRTLVQPRGGVALIDDHIKLLRCLQDEGGADLLPTTTDTYTRNMRFQEAARGIQESIAAGRVHAQRAPRGQLRPQDRAKGRRGRGQADHHPVRHPVSPADFGGGPCRRLHGLPRGGRVLHLLLHQEHETGRRHQELPVPGPALRPLCRGAGW